LDNSYQVLKRGGRLFSVSMPPNAEKAVEYGISASFVRGELPSDVIQETVEDYANGKIKLKIAHSFDFNVEDVKQAHLAFDDRAISGKQLIVMGEK
jgi:NADPH:quinone reductase-like Zn-dependent oxidoreductase